ncbi:hypothetical protein [Kutzneria sp. 744]|uniref:hypothetical protein n=1 Tax=Kutzneria sp. (strain 744) TaxID=345341 RepID=UPI0012F82888|nr:hypothetical protein [Kutzneria sp. 744]
MQDEVDALLGLERTVALVVRVFLDLLDGLGGDGGDIGVADEQQQRRLGVAPGEVVEQLVKRVGDDLGAVVELALADEPGAIASDANRTRRSHAARPALS